MSIKDSGERTVFQTGAQRDMQGGKGDMVSVPWEAVLRLSKHYEAGAKKYERWNYRKGIPVSSFIDSACRHLAKYQCGMDDEDHLAAAAFNVLGAMLMENTMPEMVDLPLRAGKKTFGYFDRFESSDCNFLGTEAVEARNRRSTDEELQFTRQFILDKGLLYELLDAWEARNENG